MPFTLIQSKATNLGEEIDQWRITANFTGDVDPISSNWERSDSAGFGKMGTGMTESSGIFSFPSTGYWLVRFTGIMETTNSENNCDYKIKVTTNNSSYDAEGESTCWAAAGGTGEASAASTEILLDVTDVSNVKVCFSVGQADNANTTYGSSTRNLTFATFIRLGDT